jgi:hypothetical protein
VTRVGIAKSTDVGRRTTTAAVELADSLGSFAHFPTKNPEYWTVQYRPGSARVLDGPVPAGY